MSPMIAMSRAILRVLSVYGNDLKDLDDDVLTDFDNIVGAFARDIRAEVERREVAQARSVGGPMT